MTTITTRFRSVRPLAPDPGYDLSDPTGDLSPRPGLDQLWSDWRREIDEDTARAYDQAVDDFARWMGTDRRSAVVELLQHPGHANHLAVSYKDHLRHERGLSSSTITVRLAAIKRVVRLARRLGLISWAIEVRAPKSERYRDTAGPGVDWIRRAFQHLSGDLSPAAVRDRAIIRLAYNLGLRRGSISTLDLSDVDLAAGTITVWLKGKAESRVKTVPGKALQALADWIYVRGGLPGSALFVALDKAHWGHRLSGRSIARLVSHLALRIGGKARPHGLRHTAITEALERSGGDIAAVMAFADHSRSETTARYDDNRRNRAGKIAELLDE